MNKKFYKPAITLLLITSLRVLGNNDIPEHWKEKLVEITF